jgi:hypothetical protein
MTEIKEVLFNLACFSGGLLIGWVFWGCDEKRR